MRSRNNNTDDSRYYFDWLEFAAADLLAAKVLCENGSCNALSAFHCQQAIENTILFSITQTFMNINTAKC